MSSDGADIGVGAERALGTILGGEDQPSEEERETREQMEGRIRNAPISADGYDGAATACARIILEAYEEYPVLRNHPTEGVYLTDQAGQMVWFEEHKKQAVVTIPGLVDVLKQLHEQEPEKLAVFSDLTGFMWGWAVNAARHVLGLDPKPNPAILEIG